MYIRLYNNHLESLLIDGRRDDAKRWLATMLAKDIRIRPAARNMLDKPLVLQKRRNSWLNKLHELKGPESTEAAWRCYRSNLAPGGVLLDSAAFDAMLLGSVSAEQQASVVDDMVAQGCEKTATT